jgi:hypothetical protein
MLTSGAAQTTFGYELYTAFHGVTGRVLYESRCDSSDRALVLWCALCIECGLQADRQCGYLRCLSEPPFYFSSSFFFFPITPVAQLIPPARWAQCPTKLPELPKDGGLW